MISVVIPTYNRARWLSAALRCVARQTYADKETIVVDDGSDDDTEAVVRSVAPSARYLRIPHSGVSAARNRGVSAARGEWIAFLDSDDYWLPEKLACQMEFVENRPGMDACQTDEAWIRNGVRVNPGLRHRKPSGDIYLPSLDLCLVSPSSVAIRRATFERLGGFDEGLAACEDYDLWLRLAVDTEVFLIPRRLVVRRAGHADQLSRRYWGMDRFRVASLSRLLASRRLDGERYERTLEVLVRKCEILAGGAERRGRHAEAGRYRRIAQFHAGERRCADGGLDPGEHHRLPLAALSPYG